MAEEKASDWQEFTLEPECELRFEVEYSNKVTLELKDGFAEVFGTELVRYKKYEFGDGAKIAVFTWQGCILELSGEVYAPYIGKNTPMNLYYNYHATMERMRVIAENENKRGPVTMVVGPKDVGKSTLCRILLNYAARMKRKPIYVNLHVDQGSIAIPGTVGALLVESTSDVVDGFNEQIPLVFHFGHRKPNDNVALYNLLISRLAEVCSDRLQANEKSKVSGIVINTCSWIKDDGYQSLIHAMKAFEVDTILVLDQERLYHELIADIPVCVKVVFLPKSGGTVERKEIERMDAGEQRIREYFYGCRTVLHPHSFEINWSDVRIYRIKTTICPTSINLVAVNPGLSLAYHVLSVSFVDSPEDHAIQTNVIGFICVTNVDIDQQIITVLSPQPPPLPSNILLLSDIQFVDYH